MPNPKKLDPLKWTLVQHSACGYRGLLAWERGVETRQVGTDVEEARVRKAGGFLFDTYGEAEDQMMKSNYPKGTDGPLMYPEVLGTFAEHLAIDGLKIYIPKTETKVIG